VVIGTRLLWMNVTPYVICTIDRRTQQRLRRVGFRQRQRQPMAWAGFRGGVSLAAALAVPQDVPGRDLIVLVTFGVILVTLVVHGLTLPAVLRWAHLTDDGSEAREHALAERAATEAGLSALPATAERLGIGPEIVERVRADYEEHLHVLADPTMPTEDPVLAAERGQHADDQRLRAALIAEKRAAAVGLRDSRKIDDIVLRRLQSRLDAEEVRLAAPSTDPE
jgi:NhaP-type Na+/H+ or K+/H+ antiporter